MNTILKELSPHFSLSEAVASDMADRKGIFNIPPTSVMVVMRQTAMEMEIVRKILGVPIQVTSWYRSPALNEALGSKNTSQHLKGEAVDFKAPKFGTPLDICRCIIKHKNEIHFDQLILEHSWVHISFAILNGKPRNQVLSLLNNNHYAQGLTDGHGVPYKV